jgi:hypothetical protein
MWLKVGYLRSIFSRAALFVLSLSSWQVWVHHFRTVMLCNTRLVLFFKDYKRDDNGKHKSYF